MDEEKEMDKKLLINFVKEKKKLKINLKNGFFYTGIILKIEEQSILFKDKFGDEIPIDIDSISYVLPAERRGK